LVKSLRMTEHFRNWINGLKDLRGRARIQVRVDRLAHGNPGECRRLGQGVNELKIRVGPGYRVYFTEWADEVIILLTGGDKSSQREDIQLAIELARNIEDLPDDH
jgi:putative addiction module killer protein